MLGGTLVFREFDGKYYIDHIDDNYTTTHKLSGYDGALKSIRMLNTIIKRHPIGRTSYISDTVIYTNVTKKMAKVVINVARDY
jgi:hypothetical protein